METLKMKFDRNKSFRDQLNATTTQEEEWALYDLAEEYVAQTQQDVDAILRKSGYTISRSSASHASQSVYWDVADCDDVDGWCLVNVRFSDHGLTGSQDPVDVMVFWGESASDIAEQIMAVL
jgi:hypothetical protein